MGPHSHHLHRAIFKVGKDGSHQASSIGTSQAPFPKWYNAQTQCNYHGGNLGHSMENCTTLKYKVRDLINDGKLKFEDWNKPVEVEDSSKTKMEMPKQKR